MAFTGKEKCEILKKIRLRMAALNDIEYVPNECNHQGDCKGVCPACEKEMAALMEALDKRIEAGFKVHIDDDLVEELERWQSDFEEEEEEELPEGIEKVTMGEILPSVDEYLEGEAELPNDGIILQGDLAAPDDDPEVTRDRD